MSSRSKFLIKACVGLVLLLGVLHFLIVEARGRHENGEGSARVAEVLLDINKEASGRMKQGYVEALNRAKRKHRVLSKIELHYISKRKVPNGPDPIHNRGAGKYHRPPGHA